MNATKVLWGFRALIYKALYRNIGLPSYIGKPIYISKMNGLIFGKRVRIYPGMRAEIVDDDAKIIIGNNSSIGQNFHVVSNTGELIIGNNVTIAGNVFITNCDHDYKGYADSVLDNKLITNPTCIEDGCFIGNNVVILAGSHLGNNCVVGANSVVRGSFPSGSVIVGSPAKVIKQFEKNK